MNKLFNLVKAGSFEEAVLCCASEDVLADVITKIACENNITALVFAYYLLSKEELINNHKLIAVLLMGFFSYFRNAEHAVYSHWLRCLEADPENIDVLQELLRLYGSSDNHVHPIQFRNIAKRILLKDPTNEQAQEIVFTTASYEGFRLPLLVSENALIKERIKKFIENGYFPEAKKELATFSWEELKGVLRVIARDKNICAYDFLWMLITERETTDLHLLGAEMFEKNFSMMYAPIPGAEVVRSFHERRARELLL